MIFLQAQLKVHAMPEEFKNATIIGHFGFVFMENFGKKIACLSSRHLFEKFHFQKSFLCTPSAMLALSNSSGFEERFRKAPFGDGLVWTVELTVFFQISPASVELKTIYRLPKDILFQFDKSKLRMVMSEPKVFPSNQCLFLSSCK